MKLMIWKNGDWVHATKEDVVQFNPWLLKKGLKVWAGNEWTPIEVLLKEENKNGN